MQKSALTVWQNYFLIKGCSTFSAKMFHALSFENVYYNYYGVLIILYGRDCRFFTLHGTDAREENKKRQNMAK